MSKLHAITSPVQGKLGTFTTELLPQTKEQEDQEALDKAAWGAAAPSRTAKAQIATLETLSRRTRELGIRMGDQYAIDEEAAIAPHALLIRKP